MDIKERLENDNRITIDEFNLARILYKPISKYYIDKVPLRLIKMKIDGVCMPLEETIAYKYLTAPEEYRQKYIEYCNKYGKKNANRTLDNYNALIKSLSSDTYSLDRGAIFINQDNILLEGQHRCCILLYQNGKDYAIDVVRIVYKHWRLERLVKAIKEKIK